MKDKKRIIEVLGKNKYVLLVILAGVFLILLPIGGSGQKGVKEQSEEPASVSEFSLSEQEERISRALTEIEGAGSVTVVLTLKSSAEQVLATDTRHSGKSAKGEAGDESVESSQTTVIITTGSQSQSPVTRKYIYPEYLGALIVAEGADDARVRLALLEAVSGLTGLKSDKITVTKMKIN